MSRYEQIAYALSLRKNICLWVACRFCFVYEIHKDVMHIFCILYRTYLNSLC